MNAPGGLLIAAALQWVVAAVALLQSMTLIVAGISISGSPVEAQLQATLVAQGIEHVSGHTVTTGIIIAGIALLVTGLGRIVLSWFLVQGRAWARLVLALIAVLSLLSGFVDLFNDDVIRGVLTIAIDVVVLYLMFNTTSSSYITEMSAKRHAAKPA